jgi:CheY-like chemotaxis protein/GAF domain-containing protein
MSKILVVDDHATNRKLLVTLLNSEGYLTVEAVDGSDGLATACREKPNLIISDILMPTMDGYEFIRRLRDKPDFADTPVIFYTAQYHEHEARALAQKCGVQRVLVKPSSHREVVAAVEQALTRSASPAEAAAPDPNFDVEHLRLLTSKLAQNAEELRAVNARLSALTNLNVHLASERNPRELLQQVCAGARYLLGARYAVLAVEEASADKLLLQIPRLLQPSLIQCYSGLDFGAGRAPQVSLTQGLLGRVYTDHRARRAYSHDGTPIDIGLPAGYPAARAVLAVPVSSLVRTYGWLCVVDKVGAQDFNPHDEHLLSILGAQVGRVYENSALYRALQGHTSQLEKEIEDGKRANARLRDSEERVVKLNRVYAMLSGINSLIVRASDRGQLLREVCRIAVEQGRFKAAWCGLIQPSAEIAQAAAAGELPAGGDDARDGARNIGQHSLVAAAMQSLRPAVCNNLGGPEVTDPLSRALFARGCRALAAVPLLMGGSAAVGCLVLIASEVAVFDDAEVVLLSEMGADVSFALDHIDKAVVGTD